MSLTGPKCTPGWSQEPCYLGIVYSVYKAQKGIYNFVALYVVILLVAVIEYV